MSYPETIASLLKVKPSQVEATIRLLDEGNTVPFISRYRKEMTGTLDDEQVRMVADEVVRLRGIDDRRATILASVEEQGKLTDELRSAIEAADSMTALEDLNSYQKFAQAHVDGLKNLIASFKTLYSAMPEAQRKVADDVFNAPGPGPMPARG